jgi:hypothetical protein
MPSMLTGKKFKAADEDIFNMVSLEVVWIIVQKMGELRNLYKGCWRSTK